MDTKTQLINLGVDYDDAMARFGGSEAMLVKFLRKFPGYDTFDKLLAAVAEKNAEESLLQSHTLKGNTGNLSLTKLYGLFSEQVRLFRVPDAEAAYAMMPEIEAAYKETVEKISEL